MSTAIDQQSEKKISGGQSDSGMKVWIRVYVGVHDDVERTPLGLAILPTLHVVVYPSEQDAKQAVRTHGGLVFLTDASKLREMFELPTEFDLDFGKEDKSDDSVATNSDSVTVNVSSLVSERTRHTYKMNDRGEEWLGCFEKAVTELASVH